MSVPEAPWVEVAYACPERQTVVRIDLVDGMTAMAAVEAAKIADAHPELRDRKLDLGIYGHPVPASYLLRSGDRVEIYRPLAVDPREARRRLAAEGLTMGRTGPKTG